MLSVSGFISDTTTSGRVLSNFDIVAVVEAEVSPSLATTYKFEVVVLVTPYIYIPLGFDVNLYHTLAVNSSVLVLVHVPGELPLPHVASAKPYVADPPDTVDFT